jgi:hypothetical protein
LPAGQLRYIVFLSAVEAGDHQEAPMAAGSGVRIGDAEREAMAASLREHYSLGRLTLDEFQQRLDAVFAARTDQDLARISADLPHLSSYAAPWPSAPVSPAGSPRNDHRGAVRHGPRLRGQARNGARPWIWVSLALLMLAICIFAWPFSLLPKSVVIVIAILSLMRRIFRRVIGGGRRR